MPITILDGIVLAVTLFSAVLAMVRGFSREVLAVFSWIIAAAAAYYFYPELVPFASKYTHSATIAKVGSAGVIFLVVLIIVSVITMRVADFIVDSRVGALDRVLGFLFGAARGLLLVVVAVMFFNWLVPPKQQPIWVSEAKSKPLIDSLGNKLVNMLPANADAKLIDKLHSITGSKQAPADGTTGNETGSGNGTGQ